MREKTSQILYAYWNEVRRGRLAPRRFDIEPSRIAGILAATMILERVDASNYQFRLAGTRICEQFGSELRGTNFFALWDDRDRNNLKQRLAEIADSGAVAVLEFEGKTRDERIASFEAILLPLLHAQPRVDRFVGAISCARTPFWLGREPIVEFALMRIDVVWPDGRPHALLERMDRRSAFLPGESRGRIVRAERRVFRVLDGGRASGNPSKQ